MIVMIINNPENSVCLYVPITPRIETKSNKIDLDHYFMTSQKLMEIIVYPGKTTN